MESARNAKYREDTLLPLVFPPTCPRAREPDPEARYGGGRGRGWLSPSPCDRKRRVDPVRNTLPTSTLRDLQVLSRSPPSRPLLWKRPVRPSFTLCTKSDRARRGFGESPCEGEVRVGVAEGKKDFVDRGRESVGTMVFQRYLYPEKELKGRNSLPRLLWTGVLPFFGLFGRGGGAEGGAEGGWGAAEEVEGKV